MDSGKRLTMSIAEVAQALGIAKSSAYLAVSSGALPSVRIGKRLLVPREALERIIAAATNAERG